MRKKQLTQKQKAFVKEYLKTNNATESAMIAYETTSRNTAGSMGCSNLKNPLIVNAIESVMDEHNLTDSVLVEKLKEGLDATLVGNYQGTLTQTAIPDYDARFKYWEAGAKIRNFFPAQKIEQKNLNIDIELESLTKKEFANLLKTALKEVKTK